MPGSGEQVWDLIVFPPSEYAEPVIGTARVNANTLVDESRAVAQPGQWVEVQGITIGPDQYQADVMRLDQPVPVAISGELRAAGVWLGSSRLARLADQAEGEVLIRGLRLGNGVVWAERITPIATRMR